MRHTTLSFLGLIFILTSCTTIHENKEFKLTELGFVMMLPANSTIQYDAPSHSEGAPKYQISYNDGNSSHSSVQASLVQATNYHVTSLEQLVQQVKNEGGTILKEYTYANGFIGCSYEKNGNRLYQFIKIDRINKTYIVLPNEIYNNQHKYLPIILRAIESIEFEGV